MEALDARLGSPYELLGEEFRSQLGQPRPKRGEVVTGGHAERLARAGESSPRRDPRKRLDDHRVGDVQRRRRIARGRPQVLGGRDRQVVAGCERLESAFVDELVDQIAIGQHHSHALGEPSAVTRREEQRGVGLGKRIGASV